MERSRRVVDEREKKGSWRWGERVFVGSQRGGDLGVWGWTNERAGSGLAKGSRKAASDFGAASPVAVYALSESCPSANHSPGSLI